MDLKRKTAQAVGSNEDGQISEEEVGKMMRRLGVKLSDDELRQCVHACKKTHQHTMGQFAHWLQQKFAHDHANRGRLASYAPRSVTLDPVAAPEANMSGIGAALDFVRSAQKALLVQSPVAAASSEKDKENAALLDEAHCEAQEHLKQAEGHLSIALRRQQLQKLRTPGPREVTTNQGADSKSSPRRERRRTSSLAGRLQSGPKSRDSDGDEAATTTANVDAARSWSKTPKLPATSDIAGTAKGGARYSSPPRENAPRTNVRSLSPPARPGKSPPKKTTSGTTAVSTSSVKVAKKSSLRRKDSVLQRTLSIHILDAVDKEEEEADSGANKTVSGRRGVSFHVSKDSAAEDHDHEATMDLMSPTSTTRR